MRTGPERRSVRPPITTTRGPSQSVQTKLVDREAAAIVQDAEAYQRLLDVAALADAEEGIRQGLDDTKKGKTRPVREFFDEFEATYDIRR